MTRLPSDAPEIPLAELREIASAVALMQSADALSIHAHRDQCLGCLLVSLRARVDGGLRIPARFLENPAWMYKHVTAPGTRIAARDLDRHLERGEGRG